MLSPLAYADPGDSGNIALLMLLGVVLILATIVILAVVLIALTRRRQHPKARTITIITCYWAAITAGTLVYYGAARMRWSKEYTIDIESGYFDPHDKKDEPQIPWIMLAGSGIVYIAMAAWVMGNKNADED